MSAIFIDLALLAFSSARRVEETEELLRREEAQSHAQQRAPPLPEEPIARTWHALPTELPRPPADALPTELPRPPAEGREKLTVSG